MARLFKWLLSFAFFTVLATAAALYYGIQVPESFWRPSLAKLQQQLPNHELDVRAVILKLEFAPTLQPTVEIQGLSIENGKSAESLMADSFLLKADGLTLLREQKLLIHTLSIEGLSAKRNTSYHCASNSLRCLPLTPFGLVAAVVTKTNKLPIKTEFQLHDIEFSQWDLATHTLSDALAMRVNVDLFSLQLKHNPSVRLGLRAELPADAHSDNPTEPNRLSIALSGTPKPLPNQTGWQFTEVQSDAKFNWQGTPWSAALSLDRLAIHSGGKATQPTNIQSFRKSLLRERRFEGQGLNAHLRRDDKPETHQAAFSSESFEGGLPAAPLQLSNAKWTFSNDEAQAWSFNLTFNPALGTVQIEPAQLKDSEAVAAQTQVRQLNCHNNPSMFFGLIGSGQSAPNTLGDNPEIRPEKPYWVWKDGWFGLSFDYQFGESDFVLCPIEPMSSATRSEPVPN